MEWNTENTLIICLNPASSDVTQTTLTNKVFTNFCHVYVVTNMLFKDCIYRLFCTLHSKKSGDILWWTPSMAGNPFSVHSKFSLQQDKIYTQLLIYILVVRRANKDLVPGISCITHLPSCTGMRLYLSWRSWGQHLCKSLSRGLKGWKSWCQWCLPSVEEQTMSSPPHCVCVQHPQPTHTKWSLKDQQNKCRKNV